MRVNIMKIYLAGLLSMLSGQAVADAPWERPRPSGMTESHITQAAAAHEALRRIQPHNLGINSPRVNWGWSNRRIAISPVSNVEASELRRAFSGRYHIYPSANGRNWDVAYYGHDGSIHNCVTLNGRSYVENSMEIHYRPSVIGLSGNFAWDPGREGGPPGEFDFGWPVLADRSTGTVSVFGYYGREWRASHGWLQDEYVPVFAEKCPNLPRSASVNQTQSGETIQEIAQGARAFRGFTVAFPNDPRDPLTAEMLYWAHPPR